MEHALIQKFRNEIHAIDAPITLPRAVVALCGRFALTPDQAFAKLTEAHAILESACATEKQRLAITTQDDLDMARQMLEQDSAKR